MSYLGVELGSTRIKAVKIDKEYSPVSSGDYTWASEFKNGIWTYDINEAWTGLKAALGGIALLAAFAKERKGNETLEEYLDKRVFKKHPYVIARETLYRRTGEYAFDISMSKYAVIINNYGKHFIETCLQNS